MPTSRYKADRFIEEVDKKVDELLSSGSIDRTDVHINIHIDILEKVNYSSSDPKETSD